MKRLFFERSEKNMLRLFSKKISGLFFVFILTFLFFLPNLLLGKIPIPADDLLGLYHPWRDISLEGFNKEKFPAKNPLITDPILQTYPWRLQVVTDIKDGKLPLWNPYSFSGQPLLGNIQSAPFSIFNILFFILPFKIAWSLQILLPPALTALFMFLFLRELKISKAASIFGAFILPFTGFFMVWQTWGTIVTTAMWLPLILLLINKLFAKIHPVPFIILTFAVSQVVLSGHWQTAFYVFVASLIFFLVKLKSTKFAKGSLIIIAGFILAIVISSPQIFPSLEFINLSSRQIDQNYSPGRSDWFIPPQNLIQLLAPDFFGNPATYNYWGIWNYAEFASFIGIVPLSFALLALFKKERQTLFFIGLAVLSLLLGLENPISKIPYALNLPFISSVQPSRIIFLLVFSLSALAAFGFENFLKEKSKKGVVITLFFISILFTLLFLAKTQKFLFPQLANIDTSYVALRNLIIPVIFSFLLLIVFLLRFSKIPKILLVFLIFTLTFIELFRFYQKFTPFSKLSWIFPQTKITRFLQAQEKPFRILATDRRIFNGNTPAAYGLETVQGYDPLYLKSYSQFVSSWNAGKMEKPASFNRIVTPQKYDSKITDFMNVRYILTFDEISKPGFKKVLEEGITKVYENENAQERAYFVNEVVKVGSKDQTLEKLFDKNFDLSKSAVSEDFEFPAQDISAAAQFKDYHDQSFTIETDCDKPAPLILNNVYYPGWEAFIDGQKTSIKKVNYMFQLVLVPQGKHQVEFKFRPKSFYNGLYFSIAGVISTLLFTFFIWRKKYQ